MRIYSKLIIVLLAFIIIPVMFVSYMVYYQTKYAIEKEIFSKLNVITNEEMNEIESFFSERMSDLSILKHRSISKTTFSMLDQFWAERSNPAYVAAKKQVDQRLAVIQNEYTYVDIMLTNNAGRIINVFNPENESELGKYITDKDNVLQKTKIGIYVGDIQKTSRKEHPYVLYLAGPVYGGAGKVIGLIYLELDMSLVYKFINDNSELGKSWETFLVKKTPENKVLFISPLKYDPDAILIKTINIGEKNAWVAQKAASGESGSGLNIDYRGKEVLSAWRPILSLGWGLATKMDSEEAFLPIERLRKLLFIVIFVTIFSAVLATAAIAKSISDPIRELCRGTEIIGHGNLEYKVGTDVKDEVGQLSRALDAMTENLKNSTISIENLNKKIAEQKKAQEMFWNRRMLLEYNLQTYIDGILAVESGGHIILANNRFRELWGIPQNILDTKDDNQMLESVLYLLKDPAGFMSKVRFLYENLDQESRDEIEFIDGRCFDRYSAPLFGADGKIYGRIWSFRDITESKRQALALDASLKESIKSHEIVNSMLEDNNLIREKLEMNLEKLKKTQAQLVQAEKMEAVGRMASGVAHEVKNPLAIILQGINYFEGEFPPEEKEKRETLQMMKDSVKRADNIARALLDFSRAEELKIEDQNLNTIIESSLDLVRHKLRLSSIEAVCELGKDLPKAPLDRGKIEQVFVNLLNNAVDAMPEGGHIYFRSYLSELNTPGDKIGNRDDDIFKLGEKVIIVEIEDTGVGMSADIMDKIFDPFFTSKNRMEGTGLGLSIAKSIIEMHKGLIEVESRKGQGTKFTIVLKIFREGR